MDRENGETMESALRRAMAGKQAHAGAAQHAVNQAGAAADDLTNKAADIRKREAAEAADLLADAIERRREAKKTDKDSATGKVMELSGTVWHVRFGEEVGSFQDREDSTLHHLARLLAEPYHRFAAQEFYPPTPGAGPVPHHGRDDSSDDRALKEYEKRLKQLAQEIKEAVGDHDQEEVDRLRGEFDRLKDHLDGEHGARKVGHKKRCGTLPADEKASQNIRMGLKNLKTRIRGAGLPKLADHLDKYINNSECVWLYVPPSDTSPWHVTHPASRK